MFTAKDAIKGAGMEDQKHTFDRWLQAGIARPTVPSRGRGHGSEWTGADIVALYLTKVLGQRGIELKYAADIAQKAIKDIGKKRKHQWNVAIDMDTLDICTEVKGEFKIKEFYGIGPRDVMVLDMTGKEVDVANRLGINRDELFGGK